LTESTNCSRQTPTAFGDRAYFRGCGSTEALLARDMSKVLKRLQEGIQSAGHQDYRTAWEASPLELRQAVEAGVMREPDAEM
jgi:hypothetical protein